MSSLIWETISIGSDESGKGDFFGAPTVAAVKLDEETLRNLKKQSYYFEIKDSKGISNDKIKEIAPKIMEICKYQRITLTPTEYNELYAEFKNVNALLASLHNKVHCGIEGSETRIMDAFSNEKNYYKYLKNNDSRTQKIDNFCAKADSQYLSVALASIIARYYYIKQIEEFRVQTGVQIPYGNSYSAPNSVITAYQQLLDKGFSEEQIKKDLVKSHFSTLEKIKDCL